MNKSNAAVRLEHDGFDYEVESEPECDIDFRGSFAYDTEAENREAEQWIADELARGNDCAWCFVRVTATERNPRPGFLPRVGVDSVGGCSYESQRSLEDSLIPEMKAEARHAAMQEPLRLCPDAAHAAYAYLMGERCSNYGYDRRNFHRISKHRAAARKLARTLTENGRYPERLNWHCAGDRLTLKQDPTSRRWSVSYTVGQSSNEEITNLLRRLVNPEAAWRS